MNTVISIIIGVILLSVIIIFHELGHFIVAKKNGIKVTEFMLGMGPKIFSFKKGETLYSFRLLLIGGACQMLGEDSDTKEDGSFNSKGPWAKFSTIIAGPLFNFILAFMFAAIIVAILGYDSPTVINVNSGSPAATTVFTNFDDPNDKVTGMQIGDVIDEYNDKSYSLARELTYDFVLDKMTSDPFDIVFIRDGKKYKGTIEPTIFRKYLLGFSYGATDDACKITEVSDDGVMMKEGVRTDDIIKSINGTEIRSGKELSEYFSNYPLDGSTVTMVIEHKGTDKTYNIVPLYTESSVSPRYYDNSVGIYFDHNESRISANPFQILKYSLYEVKLQISITIKALGKLVTGQLNLANNVGGPVRIVSELDNTIQESKEDGVLYIFLNLLNFAILLSANLGVMNLLPLPALDGGRLIFIIIELVRGKPVPKEKEGIVHAIGMVFFMVLMVLVLFNDIRYVFF